MQVRNLKAGIIDTQSFRRDLSGDLGGGLSFEIKTLEVKNGDPWVTPTLSGDWVALATAGDTGPRYMKHYDGSVEVYGGIKNGTLNTTAFVLPYPPDSNRVWAVESNGAFGILKIDSSGNFIPVAGSAVSFRFCVRYMPLEPYPPRLSDSIKIQTDLKSIYSVIPLKAARVSRNTPEGSNRDLPSSSPGLPEFAITQDNHGYSVRLISFPWVEFGSVHLVDVMIVGTK